MAQKKVILQDGQNDLMPKTLASVVFTEDGTSVETALKNLGSGGGSSGGGTGNVKVTNASGLVSSNYYAFKPSANGSLEGRFATIPYANDSQSGLMGSNDKRKLDDIKALNKFPLAVASLTNNSTSEEILQAIGAESSQAYALLHIMLLLSNAEVTEYTSDYPQVFIGNTPANMRCTYDSEAASGTMELTYVAAGGKLRTITISGKQGGASPDYTYTYSCAVTESGDDTYYLPANIFDLTESSTAEDFFEMFGGAEKFKKLWTYVPGRKFYIPYSSGNKNNFASYIPASVRTTAPLSYQLDIVAVVPTGVLSLDYEIRALTVILMVGSWDLYAIRKETIYPSGFPLTPEVYSLTSSSDTDTISTAVGGESGLKAIIQAVKDGNRLVIRGTLDNFAEMTINQDVQCSMYKEADNGDINIILSGRGYLLWGGTGGLLNIKYTKSSNTFSCLAATD